MSRNSASRNTVSCNSTKLILIPRHRRAVQGDVENCWIIRVCCKHGVWCVPVTCEIVHAGVCVAGAAL